MTMNICVQSKTVNALDETFKAINNTYRLGVNFTVHEFSTQNC